MSKESWKVFVACALGAGIGSLVALELNQWLWWIGLIVGGLTGYFSYEWRAVVRAIPAAWKAANGIVIPWQFWATIGLLFTATCYAIMWPLLPMLALGAVFDDINHVPRWAAFIAAFGAFGGGTAAFLILMLSLTNPEGTAFDKVKKANWNVCPISVLFWHLPRGIHWLWVEAPRFFRFCKRLGWEFFIRVHSERRLLCGVDAMLGAGVGYFAGSAIIGALSGGVFGLVNYAVVTKRILEPRGLLPAR